MVIPYMEVFDFTASKHLTYKVRTCMIDENLLQAAQRSWFNRPRNSEIDGKLPIIGEENDQFVSYSGTRLI